MYVIDSQDWERFPDAKENIHKEFSYEQIANAKILFLANKQYLQFFFVIFLGT